MRNTFTFLIIIFLAVSCKKESLQEMTSEMSSPSITLIHDEFENTPIVVAGSQSKQFIVSFKRRLEGNTLLDFEAVKGQLPIIMKDNEGTQWDLWGNGVNGPRKGAQLIPTHSTIGYWFVFGAMYPGAEIFKGEKREGESIDANHRDWLIPVDNIARGATFDAIKSLDDPSFLVYSSRNHIKENQNEPFFLKDDDLVIGLNINGEARAYPHNIIGLHEVVNDEIKGQPISVIFCPLTGTAVVWDRALESGLASFGVSGLVYNSNILPYDKVTNSLWTQLDGLCVNGSLSGTLVKRYPFVETTWGIWKSIYESPKVLSEDTGFDRDYTCNFYCDYAEDHDYIAYPIAVDDDRLPAKERVHGIIQNGKAKVYRFSAF